MRNGLTRVRAVVHHESKSVLKIQLFCDLAGNEEQVAEQGLVRGSGFANARNDLLWYDQQMDRRLRLDVMQHEAVFVLVLDFSGDFAGDNFFEEGWHGSEGLPANHANRRE